MRGETIGLVRQRFRIHIVGAVCRFPIPLETGEVRAGSPVERQYLALPA